MKKTLIGSILLLAGCTMMLQAQELIRNGSFENGTEGWTVKGKSTLNTTDKTEGKQSLCVVKAKNVRFDEIWQKVKVEPNTDYELSYYVKCQDMVQNNPQAKAFGVSASVSGGGKRSCWGSGGLWKYDNGTFDWKKVTVRFNTRNFKNPDSLLIGIQCPSASGTFLLDAVSLRKVEKK